jgi:hypothetical protein
VSFINLMADDRWTDEAINERMRALRRSLGWPDAEWEFIVQKMLGALVAAVPAFSGVAYNLSADEVAEIQAFAAVLYQVQSEGRAARADMALLNRVLDAESGIAELAPDDAAGQALLTQRAAARAAIEESTNESPAPVVPVDGNSP